MLRTCLIATAIVGSLSNGAGYDVVPPGHEYHGNAYMNAASGAISFDTTYAGNVVDDGTSTYAEGSTAGDGFTVVATGALSPDSPSSNGVYDAKWQISFSGTVSRTHHATLSVDNNSNQLAECESHRTLSAGSAPVASMSGFCTITVTYVGDTTDDVRLAMKSDSTANATIEHVQIMLTKHP